MTAEGALDTRSSVARALGIGVVALVVALASPVVAHAQPAKPATAEDTAKAEARARFEEGIKQAEANDHESARLKFNQAWALLKSPAILFNLARSEQLSGHNVDALEHYRHFVKLPADPKITDAQRQRATESIAELSKKVGQIEVEAPAGARVSVDGRAIDAGASDPIAVAPGKHVVEAIADGKVKSVTVDCPAGAITKAKLVEAAVPTAVGIDGSISKTPTPPRTTEPPKEESPDSWTTGRAVGIGLVGLGLVAAGIGVGFHISAGRAEDEANSIRASLPPSTTNSQCSDPGNEVACAQLRSANNNKNDRSDVRTGAFIGAGAFVVGGAVLFLLSSPKSEPARGMRVVPIVTGREAGLSVLGSF